VILRERVNRVISRLRRALHRMVLERNRLWLEKQLKRDELANALWREQHLLAKVYAHVDFREIERLNREYPPKGLRWTA
jgi:hypothetical protein